MPDPVSAAIERHLAAREELSRTSAAADVIEKASKQAEDAALEAEKVAEQAEGAAWADLVATRPADVSGAVRLLRYVSTSPASEILEDPQDLLRQLTAAVEAVETSDGPGEGVAAVEPDPALSVVADFRAAWDALGEAIDAAGAAGAPEVAAQTEDAEGEAYERLKTVRPTTPEGFRALAGAWAMVLGGERMGEPSLQHADHAADSLIAGAGVCVPLATDAPVSPALADRQRFGLPTAGDPVDWTKPPHDFMAPPAIEPFGFARIPDGIALELKRLHGIARAEFVRRSGSGITAERAEELRRELRLDALEKALRGEGGFAVGPGATVASTAWDWQAEAARHPGFVPFPTGAPKVLLALDEAIRREAQRFLKLAEAEVERSRSAYAGSPDPALWPRVERAMRREMRMDALALVSADAPAMVDRDASDPDAAAPVSAPVVGPSDCKAPAPALSALVSAWEAVERAGNAPGLPSAERAPLIDRASQLLRTVYAFPAHTVADLCAKLPAFRDEAANTGDAPEAPNDEVPLETCALRGIVADLERLAEACATGTGGSVVTAAPDPVFAAIAASRKAELRMEMFQVGLDKMKLAGWQDREVELSRIQLAAREAVWRTVPTTQAGRCALVEYARFQAEVHAGETGIIDNAKALFEEILAPIAAAVAAERHLVPHHQQAEHDITSLSIAQLTRLYGALEPFEDLIGGAEMAGTPEGTIISREADRLGRLVRAIADEIECRHPVDGAERIDRLNVLVRRAALLDGLTTNRALLTEALAVCEG